MRNHPKRESKPVQEEVAAAGPIGVESAPVGPIPPKRGAKNLRTTKHKHQHAR